MCLRLMELQTNDEQPKEVKVEMKESWKDINKVLHFQVLPYIHEIIRIKLISWHRNNLLASHFKIEKTE